GDIEGIAAHDHGRQLIGHHAAGRGAFFPPAPLRPPFLSLRTGPESTAGARAAPAVSVPLRQLPYRACWAPNLEPSCPPARPAPASRPAHSPRRPPSSPPPP